MLDSLLKDLKHALRMLRQSPGFTFAAVAALALGIGANTAIFSVVNAVLLRPLPYPEPDRLVLFETANPAGSYPWGSPTKFENWRRQTTVAHDVAAFATGLENYTGAATPEQFRAERVSADFFRLFGARTLHGRTFTPEEDLPKSGHFVVLSKSLWERRFDHDPNIVGKTISLSGEPHVVVGVLDEFSFTEFESLDPEVWIPFQLDPNSTDQGHFFHVIGRLAPGVTLEQARTQLKRSTEEFLAAYPTALQPKEVFNVRPASEALVAGARKSLSVLIGAVGFVLLIACANVANLLLARAAGRKREIAIRTALGGSRWRIMRQLLTESVVLSVAAGTLGLALGAIAMRALLTVNTAGLPRVGKGGAMIAMDWRVLTFTLVVSVATGIFFGLIPALSSSRADLSAAFKEGGGRSGSGFRQNKARSIFVVTEIALALVLLVGSALFIRTAVALGRVNPGYDTHNVLTMQMSLTGPRFDASAAVEQVVRDGVQRLQAIPGVEVASASCCIPLEGGYGEGFAIAGRAREKGPFNGGAAWKTVSTGYFEVFKIAVKRGRSFTDRDDAGSAPVVIINEAMANRFWPKANPLGERITIGRGGTVPFADEPERTIVGVVGDTRDGSLDGNPFPQMFVPQAQDPDSVIALFDRMAPMVWVVRTRTDPLAFSKAVEEQLRQATGLPVANIRSMAQITETSTSRQRFNTWLMTVFGSTALLLAAIGIYGLMAYTVVQRTQEIGIRLALGADGAQVKNMVVAQGMRLALVGVVVGVAASFALARVISGFLFGVNAWDPLVFVSAPLVLSAVALVAVWWPARRASRVDPLNALRHE